MVVGRNGFVVPNSTLVWWERKHTKEKQNKNPKETNVLLVTATYGCLRHPEIDLDLHTLAGLSVILIVYAIYLRV